MLASGFIYGETIIKTGDWGMGTKSAVFACLSLAFLFLLLSPSVKSPLVEQSCTHVECAEFVGFFSSTPRECECSEINTPDGIYAAYENDGLRIKSYEGAYVFSYQNSTEIPLGSRITNVRMCVKWNVTSSIFCNVSLYNGSYVIVSNSCNVNTDVTDCYDVTEHVPNASVANNLGIEINATRYSGGGEDHLYVDYMRINVTYEKYIKPVFWNLTNYTTGEVLPDGAELTRGDLINVSALWNTTSSLASALANHNGTGSFANYTIPLPYTENWTNYTINLSDVTEFPKAGRINVTIFANETYGWGNETQPRYFYLWGFASVADSYLNDSLIYNGTSVLIACKVADSNSSMGIGGYNVSFYSPDGYLGSNLTNTSGWAVWVYTDSTPDPPRTYNLTCNITDEDNLYYNVSTNHANLTLEVNDLSLNASVNESEINFGGSVRIIANITTDGTPITSVWANISFLNVTSGILSPAHELVNLTLNQTISDHQYVYDYIYTPPRSGEYNITIFVTAGRTRTNTTGFNVTFGSPQANFVFPNFRILHNQTFNLTVNVTAVGGDMFRTNFTLNLANHSVLNITSGETWSAPELYNLTNGTTITLTWECRSLGEGLTKAVVSANYDRRTNESSVPFEVLKPILLAEPGVINISQSVNITAKIVGNTSRIDFINFEGSGCSQYSPTRIVNESECVGTAAGVGNIAPDASETCDPSGECSYTNDDSEGTSWTAVGSGRWVNLSLGNTYIVSRIEIIWKDLGTNSNVTISYTNETGQLVTLYANLSVPDSKNTTDLSDFLPFRTNTLFFNQTTDSTLVVYEIKVYTIEERVGKCYVYEECYVSGERTGTSGTHTITAVVYTQNEISRYNFSFFVNYGRPHIQIKELVMINGSTDIYEAKVTAVNGDLHDLDVRLNIANKSVINLTEGSWNFSLSSLLNGQQHTFEWNVSSLSLGSTSTNVTVNSTTGKGHFNSSEWVVEVVSDPGELPNLTAFWIEYNSTRTNRSNLFDNIKILAKAYDDIGMRAVKASLTYPNGFKVNGSFEILNSTYWVFEFGNNDEGLELNETGNYTVEVIAVDIGNQLKYSGVDSGCPENYTLSATNVYTLVLENFENSSAFYNRGENLTVRARDVNGFFVDNVSWEANLTKFGQGMEELNGTGSAYVYTLNSSDPVGNYTFVVKGTKNNNTGENEWDFNVSSTLSPVFAAPPEGSEYPPNSGISPIPQIRIYNARGDSLPYEANVTLTCPNGEFSLLKIGDLYYNVSADCRSPSSSGINFYLYTNVTDSYNNSGTGSLRLSTSGGGSSGYQAPSGGGTSQAPVIPSCMVTPKNCTDGIDNDCDGLTDCGDPDCANDPACITIIEDFDLSLENPVLDIMQGENGTFVVSLFNLGNADLFLNISITKECCEVFSENLLFLPVKSEKDFSVVVYVPLFTETGEYLFDMKIETGGVEKTKTLKVNVRENPVISYLNELETHLPGLKSEISEYERAGIDVRILKERLGDIESSMDAARRAISNDDVVSLKNSVSSAESTFERINSELLSLGIQKFLFENRWYILGFLIALFVAIFSLTQIVLPYIKLRKEITELKEKEKVGHRTEMSAEQQYFTRQIDKQTFVKIMTGEHDKILEIRSEIEEKEKELRSLLSVRHILAMLFRFPVTVLKMFSRRGKKKPEKPAKTGKPPAKAEKKPEKPKPDAGKDVKKLRELIKKGEELIAKGKSEEAADVYAKIKSIYDEMPAEEKARLREEAGRIVKLYRKLIETGGSEPRKD